MPVWYCDAIENRRSSRGRWVHRGSLEPEQLLPAQFDLGWWASPKYTTPSSPRVSGWVTVTHPHHPLYGQQVEIIRVRRGPDPRSEEHTSELQSHSDLVCRLLLEKKKQHHRRCSVQSASPGDWRC